MKKPKENDGFSILIDSYPYLVSEGRAEETVKFYAEILKVDILNLDKFRDMPVDPDNDPVLDAVKLLVFNATL